MTQPDWDRGVSLDAKKSAGMAAVQTRQKSMTRKRSEKGFFNFYLKGANGSAMGSPRTIGTVQEQATVFEFWRKAASSIHK